MIKFWRWFFPVEALRLLENWSSKISRGSKTSSHHQFELQSEASEWANYKQTTQLPEERSSRARHQAPNAPRGYGANCHWDQTRIRRRKETEEAPNWTGGGLLVLLVLALQTALKWLPAVVSFYILPLIIPCTGGVQEYFGTGAGRNVAVFLSDRKFVVSIATTTYAKKL